MFRQMIQLKTKKVSINKPSKYTDFVLWRCKFKNFGARILIFQTTDHSCEYSLLHSNCWVFFQCCGGLCCYFLWRQYILVYFVQLTALVNRTQHDFLSVFCVLLTVARKSRFGNFLKKLTSLKTTAMQVWDGEAISTRGIMFASVSADILITYLP